MAPFFTFTADYRNYLELVFVTSNNTRHTFSDGVIGSVPQQIIDDEGDILQHWHDESADLVYNVLLLYSRYRTDRTIFNRFVGSFTPSSH